jgi:hypothetical protein
MNGCWFKPSVWNVFIDPQLHAYNFDQPGQSCNLYNLWYTVPVFASKSQQCRSRSYCIYTERIWMSTDHNGVKGKWTFKMQFYFSKLIFYVWKWSIDALNYFCEITASQQTNAFYKMPAHLCHINYDNVSHFNYANNSINIIFIL